MRFDILSVFPDMLKAVLFESVIGNAIENNIVDTEGQMIFRLVAEEEWS